ncbi:Mitochondrial carrier protein [Macleaya cordata]|uniref:Mitochondrial carrier protein n=1 Tax=Macleaya cordata TaxID=56857 RepID=A0A200Q7H6_MACCD|nr:Mitochondrial carrier protein [Macleaya cordata]
MASEEKKKNVGRETRTKSTVRIEGVKPNVPSVLANVVGSTAAAPLERLKILLQVQSSHNIKYKGTIEGLKYIWRTEGFRGLFKGNGTNVARLISVNAVKFLSYDQASRGILWFHRQQSGNEDAKLTPELCVDAGSCSGIIAMSATYPLDMVRGRLTVQTEKSPYQYRGMFHALSTVLREEGPRALYKGWLPSTIGVVICMGLYSTVYESLRARLVKATLQRLIEAKESELVDISKSRAKQLEFVKESKLILEPRLVIAAAFAACTAQIATYPFEVIHRRMQMVGWKNASSIVTGGGGSKATLEYTGMVDAFRKTVRNEGFGALYKGWVTNLVKLGPLGLFAILTEKVLKDVVGVELNIKTNATGTP